MNFSYYYSLTFTFVIVCFQKFDKYQYKIFKNVPVNSGTTRDSAILTKSLNTSNFDPITEPVRSDKLLRCIVKSVCKKVSVKSGDGKTIL